jgi:hypothetical protein
MSTLNVILFHTEICHNVVSLLNNKVHMSHLGWAFIALCAVAIFFTYPPLTDLTVSIAFFFWEWNIFWICICKYSHRRSMFAAFRTCSMKNKQHIQTHGTSNINAHFSTSVVRNFQCGTWFSICSCGLHQCQLKTFIICYQERE